MGRVGYAELIEFEIGTVSWRGLCEVLRSIDVNDAVRIVARSRGRVGPDRSIFRATDWMLCRAR